MATLDIVDRQNKKAGSVELAAAVFEAEVRPDLFHAEVRRQLAERRAGTHSTKNRAGVSGGGAKPYRQKGTGRARQGSIRSPQFAGGGVVFGPVPRSHGHKLPKKVRKKALCSALSAQFCEQAITVIEDLSIDEFKTKLVAELLAALGIDARNVLIVTSQRDEKLERSARNIPGVSVVRSEGVNVYDVLRHRALLFTKTALEQLQVRLAGTEEAS
jgi:large subunit ribosomal protein L4